MAIRTILKHIKAKQMFGFFLFFIRHPFFAISTFFATVRTYKVAEKEFPKIHGGHNKANAFRHALWNILIAKSCSRFSRNMDKVTAWTKDVTDWHEELFVNDDLPRTMDLHNNEIGRVLFLSESEKSEDCLIQLLLNLLNDSIKVVTVDEISKAVDQLVFLED